MQTYVIEQITDWEKFKADRELIYFCYHAGVELQLQYGFDWINFPMRKYIEQGRFMLCRKEGKPVGFHFSRLYESILNPDVIIAYQDLFYTSPNSRCAKLLMDDFIDFGKRAANHIITTIASNTNIKPSSLEKLGFSKLETLYRLES